MDDSRSEGAPRGIDKRLVDDYEKRMFRPTSAQRPMFGVEHRMDPCKRQRLERSWAHQYRMHALPLIDESEFAKYFHADNGRPNKSVRLVVSVLVLKERFNFTDAEALEQLEWNTAWQYALDVTPEEAHTCQKTLHNFRTKLLADDEGAVLFERTTARLIERANLHTGRQRQDSTHVVSNMKVLTRLGLFVQTITQFLNRLRKNHPRVCAKVPEELRERYLDREGYFADARSSEAPRRLAEAAVDVYRLVQRFRGHRVVARMQSFALLLRLYEDQCVPPDDDDPERIELQEKPSSSSLQSPSDPDATYGHKGKGYEVQLTETCDEDNPFEAITSVSVHGANESDQQQVEPALDQIMRTCGDTPDTMHADSGYASGDNLVEARERGTELVAPIGQKESDKGITLADFELDEAGEQVLQCPVGDKPVAHEPAQRGKAKLALFSEERCGACPLRSLCPAKQSKRHPAMRRLRFTPAQAAVAKRRVEQQTPEFKQRYKIRSGIEATNSELKRGHGFGKLRVRRRPRVALAARLKALALNIKRYVGHLTSEAAAAMDPIAVCAY